MEQLKQAILDTITKVYKKCYIGRLDIVKFKHGGYDVSIYLDCDERPLHIAAQLEFEDFLQYFEQELRRARLTDSHYYTGYKTFNHQRQYPICHHDSIKVIEK